MMADNRTGHPAAARIGSDTRRWRVHALIVLALLTCATGGHVLLRQRAAYADLTRRADLRHDALTTARTRRAAVEMELGLARSQLAELEALRASKGTVDRNAELHAWLVREKRLRELVKEAPPHAIPELRLLTDDDWLRVARDARLDTMDNRRRALAALRDTAKQHFQFRLSQALQAYLRQSGDVFPTSTLTLAPYFEQPPDPAMLSRYAMHAGGHTSTKSFSMVAIQEIAAVDPDYDSRFSITTNGASMVSPAPEAWIPDFRERSRAARAAYMKAHEGVPPKGSADVLPFFDPPLDADLVEKIIRAERERPEW